MPATHVSATRRVGYRSAAKYRIKIANPGVRASSLISNIFWSQARSLAEADLGIAFDGCIDRAGKLANLGLLVIDGVNLAGSLLLHLVDPNHRVHRDVGPVDTCELGLQPLLRRVDDDRTSFSEKQPFDLNKPKHCAV